MRFLCFDQLVGRASAAACCDIAATTGGGFVVPNQGVDDIPVIWFVGWMVDWLAVGGRILIRHCEVVDFHLQDQGQGQGQDQGQQLSCPCGAEKALDVAVAVAVDASANNQPPRNGGSRSALQQHSYK